MCVCVCVCVCACVYKKDFALNNLQWLICHKIKKTMQIFIYIYIYIIWCYITYNC